SRTRRDLERRPPQRTLSPWRSSGSAAADCVSCRTNGAASTGARSSGAKTLSSSTGPGEGTATTTHPGSFEARSASSSASEAARSRRRGSSLPEDCLFCKLVDEAEPVHKADGFVAIRDVNPKADTHLLVIPERHVETFRDIDQFPPDEAKRMLVFIAETARGHGLEHYNVIVNVRKGAGQTIFHLHWHVLG